MADRRWIDEREKFKLLRVAREYDKLARHSVRASRKRKSSKGMRGVRPTDRPDGSYEPDDDAVDNQAVLTDRSEDRRYDGGAGPGLQRGFCHSRGAGSLPAIDARRRQQTGVAGPYPMT
jgi:hypothetical protein